MDPLSISFGIAGVLPLLAKIIDAAHKYITAVAGAQKMISAFILELQVLQTAITKLDGLLTNPSLAETAVEFHQRSVLVSCCAALETKVQELSRTFALHEVRGKKALGRLQWPWTEKEHQKTMGELRSFSTWLQLALNVDGCRLMAQTSESVVAVLAGQLQQFETLRALNETTTELVGAVQKQTRMLENGVEAEYRRNVLDWVSTAKYDARHVISQRSRATNTGSWFLENTNFMAWRDGLASSRVLWCQGIQGSGKTTLACTAIDALCTSFITPARPLAYFYFDYQDHKSQTPLGVLSNLLRQLLERLPELPESAKQLYEERDNIQGRKIAEYERLLRDMIQRSDVTYIVLDALDECENINYMLNLINDLGEAENCRLLITSRPYVYGVFSTSHTYPAIQIEAKYHDIKSYILEKCNNANIHHVADQEFVDRLVDKLTQSASSMFLLPVLQLRTVLNEPTIGEMEDKLEQLTDVLSDAFDDTFTRIKRLPGSRSRLALSALMYLAHAKDLFSATELSDILSLKPGSTSLNPKYRPTAKMILDCCQGLVILDEQTNQLRLAHYSIKEYLVSASDKLFPNYEVTLALDCLNYLMQDNFEAGPLDTEMDIHERMATYPFLSYASEHWGEYVQPVETDAQVWNKLMAFYGSPPARAVSTQVKYYLHAHYDYDDGYYGVDESLSTTPLHIAAVHCLEYSCKALLQHYNVNEASAMGTTPITIAASNGQSAVVKLLLENGADPRISNWYGDALQCAAEGGRCETIRELVAWGMDPNIEVNGRLPLSCALDRDLADAVEVLVDLGANLQLDAEEEHENIFLEACHRGCEKTVDMMLRRGWVDLRSGDPHHTVLALRASMCYMVQHLLGAGADVNGVDKHGHTILWYAMKENDMALVEVLRGENATLGGSAESMEIDNFSHHPTFDFETLEALPENNVANEPPLVIRGVEEKEKRQYHCDVYPCTEEFDDLRSLRRHLGSHEKVHLCRARDCGEGFITRCRMITHLKSKHRPAVRVQRRTTDGSKV